MAESQPRYYEALGRAHDYLLRCKDCQRLVTYETLTKLGCCKCGNKRVAEVTILNDEEQEAIRSGAISFPDSDLFLKEFRVVE